MILPDELDERRIAVIHDPAVPLAPMIANLFPGMSLQTEMDREDRLLKDLKNNVYQLVVTHESPSGSQFFCKECGTESLLFGLPKDHKYAQWESLSFSEMNGENMLLMPDIGFWNFVKDRMPDSRFLTQSDRFSFNELIRASSLPFFATELGEHYQKTPPGRVFVPVSDADATVTYYLVCKAGHKKDFHALFAEL